MSGMHLLTLLSLTHVLLASSDRQGQRIECQKAVELTEAWRAGPDGSKVRPGGPYSFRGWGCDLNRQLQWFRFSGDAGNRMRDTCPPMYSCGAMMPMWTDQPPPSEVGVKKRINVYESWSPGHVCKFFAKPVEVIRCSHDTEHDLVYRNYGARSNQCYQTFCGMH
ncbi:uromodulin-like [Watersipora subatra]|uniref:uromodulin-like n=1 Tax=Watersipora subatra TaxID=2589382 RepID=UPI00355AFBE8